LKQTDLVYDLHNPPKSPEDFYGYVESDSHILRRGEAVLAATIEYMSIPDDLMGFCELRSTYARLGVSIPPTIIDATWEGQLTIQMTATRFPVTLHKGDRFLHAIFARLTSPVDQPYRGKYQRQRGVALPISDPTYRETPST
jgi:dCTP deaminase